MRNDKRPFWSQNDPRQSFEFACHRLIFGAQAFSAVRCCSNFSLFEFLPFVPSGAQGEYHAAVKLGTTSLAHGDHSRNRT